MKRTISALIAAMAEAEDGRQARQAGSSSTRHRLRTASASSVSIGPYDSEKAAKAALGEVLGQAGIRADDKNTKTADYLRTLAGVEGRRPEAQAPGPATARPSTSPSSRRLGHVKLGDHPRVRTSASCITAMRRIEPGRG